MTASTLERAAGPGQPAAPRGPRRYLARLVASPDRVALIAIIIGSFVLTATNILGSPNLQDDEGTYAAQAVAIQRGDFAPYTYWYDHPPLGWIQLAALGWIPQLLAVGSGTDIEAMRFAIAFFSVASCALVFLIARRIGVRLPFAVLASGVYALSPIALELGRQVYLDSIATTWLLLAFHAALSPRRALWHHISAGVFFAVAVLSKVTAAILGPALLVAMLDRSGWRRNSFSIVGFLSLGTLTLALYPLMAALRGELLAGPGHVSLQDAFTYQFVSRSGSGWIWEPGSHRSELVASWFGLDGYLMVGGLLAALICVLTRRTRWIPLAILCFSLPIIASQGYLPAMYILGALPFLALAIGSATDLSWRWLLRMLHRHASGARVSSPVLVALVLSSAVVLIPAPQWIQHDWALLTRDDNADWHRTFDWAGEHIPHDEVVLAPYSMWHDLNERGWHDPWTMIVLEKVDLDSQFAIEHPDGWREIEWIVEGPTTAANIDNLRLEKAGRAFEQSEVVQTFGAWSIRRVTPPDAPATSG